MEKLNVETAYIRGDHRADYLLSQPEITRSIIGKELQ